MLRFYVTTLSHPLLLCVLAAGSHILTCCSVGQTYLSEPRGASVGWQRSESYALKLLTRVFWMYGFLKPLANTFHPSSSGIWLPCSWLSRLMAYPRGLFSLGLEELCLCRHMHAHIFFQPSPSQPEVALLFHYLVGQHPILSMGVIYIFDTLCTETQLAFFFPLAELS